MPPDTEKSINPPQSGSGSSPGPPKPPFSPPPNGGLKAWLQVLAGFCLFFNTWGILNTFGVFQTYYETGALFRETSSNISWIGSIQAFCVLFVGFLSGPIFDRGYLRYLLIVGSFFIVLGWMMTSLIHEYWQAVLAQGFCIGFGSGLIFVPAVSILPTYFSTKLGLAIGLSASGSSMGGIIYPIVFYRLIDRIGFGWSVRVLGFIAFATLLIPIFVMEQRVKPPRARALIDWTVFTDVPFALFVLACFIGFIGLYTMFFYISYYGAAQQITDPALSFYLIPILNAASVFGRTVPNAMSDIYGPLNIIIPGGLICGILTFCMISVHTVAGIVVIAVFYGFFSGVFIALPPVCLVLLTKDKSRIGTRIGLAFGFVGFGTLAGGPGGGDVLQRYANGHNWTGLWVYGGVATTIAACMFFVVRILAKRQGIKT